jgi:hypothetical protein
MVKATLTGLVCFLLFLLVHVIIFRYRRPEERFKTLSVIFFSLSPFYVIAYFLLPPWQGIYSLEGALVFLSGLFLYIFLFQSHDFDEIKKVYSFDRVLSRRLEHMVHSGYLSREADHYMNTRKGRFVAYLFRFLKDFLRIGPGG